jgi:hypothetical protein
VDERVLARLHYRRLSELSEMALSELLERCYRTIGHYLSTIGVHYRTIGPGLSRGRNLVDTVVATLPRYASLRVRVMRS